MVLVCNGFPGNSEGCRKGEFCVTGLLMFLLGCRFQGRRGRAEMVQDVRELVPQPEPKPAEDENKKLPTVCDPAELQRFSCQDPGLFYSPPWSRCF